MSGRPPASYTLNSSSQRDADLPLAVWPCQQTTSQWQRHRRYLPASNEHPGKMLPALARRAIETYSDPGALVIDPMCGIGTTLVEAAHLDRRAIGIELEERWAELAAANVAHARTQHAPGTAQVIRGDARHLPRLLALHARELLRAPDAPVNRKVEELPFGRVDLVLTSPPYVSPLARPSREREKGSQLAKPDTRNYSRNRSNLGYAQGRTYRTAMAEIYARSAAVLKPGGFLVVVTKDQRRKGPLRPLAAQTIAMCEQVGLVYWQHVIALLATIGDRELIPRASFWQRLHVRRRHARGDRVLLPGHEDVLVFRKPVRGGA